jgi:hypothetical protein
MVTLPSNIIDLQEEDEFIHLLVYADSGVGKTVFAGSDDNVLFIAPEDNGTLSAKRMGSSAKKWKVNTWDDIVKAYEWLYGNFVAKDEPIPFNWIALDSLTEMQDQCMRKVLDEAVTMNPSRDPDVPQLQDWQPYFIRFRRLVKAYNSLPVNIIYTALQNYEEDEDGEKVAIPQLQGKGTQIAKETASWMTSFGRMTVIRKKTDEVDEVTGKPKFEERRMIQWSGTKSVMAKDRTMCLEPRTVNKSLKDIRLMLEAGPKEPPVSAKAKRPVESKLKVRTESVEEADDEEEIKLGV